LIAVRLYHMASEAAPRPIAARATFAFFIVVLALHFTAAITGWRHGMLPGNTFRQAQTAITTYFIDVEIISRSRTPRQYSGKPWSIPMEFPLYEWTVAALSRFTRQPLTECARFISLLCFLPGAAGGLGAAARTGPRSRAAVAGSHFRVGLSRLYFLRARLSDRIDGVDVLRVVCRGVLRRIETRQPRLDDRGRRRGSWRWVGQGHDFHALSGASRHWPDLVLAIVTAGIAGGTRDGLAPGAPRRTHSHAAFDRDRCVGHIVGGPWPPAEERLEMLDEAVRVNPGAAQRPADQPRGRVLHGADGPAVLGAR